jgi:hypothetical protein
VSALFVGGRSGDGRVSVLGEDREVCPLFLPIIVIIGANPMIINCCRNGDEADTLSATGPNFSVI